MNVAGPRYIPCLLSAGTLTRHAPSGLGVGLCFLVNGVLVASGVHTRSQALSYFALGFVVLGVLFLVASMLRNFFL
jgi:hypothetical protein